MNNNENDSGLGRWWWTGLIILGGLTVLLWLLGYGPNGSKCMAPVAAAPAVAAPVVVAPVAEPAPVAAVTAPAPAPEPAPAPVIPPAAKVFFAVNKTDLPTDVAATLDAVVAYATANPGSKVALSGFHDPTGNATKNAELALNRAKAVRDYLIGKGIVKERVEMREPSSTTGSGPPEEARRVEASIVL